MLIQRNIILSVFAVALSLVFVTSANAGPCRNNSWQPTFVHDLQFADGPWYVTSGGSFQKLRIRNGSWTAHACDLIRRSGVRNRRGYTTCQAYTRIQCGCQRGLSERNSTCARFLRQHNRSLPVTNY